MSYSKSFYSLFIVFSFASTSSCYSSTNTTTHNKCSAEESHALILFKKSLFSINDTSYDWKCSGYHSILVNWNTSTDYCYWEGVTCDHSTNDVIGLDLSCGMLSGIIHPNNTLFHLRHLQKLNLAFNYFTSEIPGEIGRLSNSLTHFNVTDCWFSGQVPTEITHLHKLASLDVSLNMYKYLLGFTYPSEHYSSLKLLNLRDTTLQGKLPHDIFKLQSLETLDLSDNSFSGDIPWEISLLPKLVSLHLSMFNVIDYLRIQPHTFYSLLKNSTLSKDLSLSQGFLPNSLVNLRHLSGNIPFESFALPALKSLDLSRNQFDGQIYLFDQGLIVQAFQQLTNLPTFHLINLKASGSWRHCYQASQTLSNSVLDMSNNNFDGEIPKCFGNIISSLAMINLGNYSFHGTIPKVYRDCAGLEGLILNGNQLQGEIPSSLSKCQSLKVLDLGNNLLNGTFPIWLERLPNLQVLVLKSNKLHGIIETSSSTKLQFQSLWVLDLSHNGFSGQLPQKYFQNLIAMKRLKGAQNQNI
uniref:Leucine-rich repeat-containing N-terminal plant-type domain-containing protein n=1 Tax=Tanacetum cinerariifolium TaxID=118510 RepID=A0A6L2K863_TANCI|nr:hypothetical protein [Tanacetum cinerariifolium]